MAILCTLGEGRYANLLGIRFNSIINRKKKKNHHFSIHVLIYEHMVHLHLEVQCPLMQVNTVCYN